MAITKKPRKSKNAATETAISAVIGKGGSVADDKTKAIKKSLQLRLPTVLIKDIDQIRDKRTVPPSRHMWILEAIHEKLEKEQTF